MNTNCIGVFWYYPGEEPRVIRTFQPDEVQEAREYAEAHKDCDEYEVFFAPACVKLPKNSKRTYIK